MAKHVKNKESNEFRKAEEIRWKLLKQSSGNQTGMYRRGEESRLIAVVPESPNPRDFDYEDQALNITVRAFKVEKSCLLGWLPKSGDTLEWNEQTYTVRKFGVRKFGSGVFYQDVGNYNVVLRIFVTEYRG